MKQFSLAQLAEMLGAELRGDAQKKILGLATLQEASADQLSFLANAHYRKQLASTQAAQCCCRLKMRLITAVIA